MDNSVSSPLIKGKEQGLGANGTRKGVFLIALSGLCFMGLVLGFQDLYLASVTHCDLGFWAMVIFPFTVPTFIVPIVAFLSLKGAVQSFRKIIISHEK